MNADLEKESRGWVDPSFQIRVYPCKSAANNVNAYLTQTQRKCFRINVAIFQASMAFQGMDAIV